LIFFYFLLVDLENNLICYLLNILSSNFNSSLLKSYSKDTKIIFLNVKFGKAPYLIVGTNFGIDLFKFCIREEDGELELKFGTRIENSSNLTLQYVLNF
jgi:hypothetical protein